MINDVKIRHTKRLSQVAEVQLMPGYDMILIRLSLKLTRIKPGTGR